MENYIEGRKFLKSQWEKLSDIKSDQQKGVNPPERFLGYDENNVICLSDFSTLPTRTVLETIKKRTTKRKFKEGKIPQHKLSYLLWATQGLREDKGKYTFRTVPSAGARHSFETYLYVKGVEGLKEGIYRYIPEKHGLIFLKEKDDVLLSKALLNQTFNSQVIFFWSCIPYRMEWRYSIVSHKMIAIDIGHVCQNLYIAAESVDLGVCAIGAYSQENADKLLGLDGNDEFVIYAAHVGKA